MTRTTRLYRLLLTSALMAAGVGVGGPAIAAVPGFYMDAAAGLSLGSLNESDRQHLDLVLEDWDEPWSFETFSGGAMRDTGFDGGGVGVALAIGYQFTPNFALEAAYLRLPKTVYEVAGQTDDSMLVYPATGRIIGRTSGPALSMVGVWPATDALSVDVRAGVVFGQEVTLDLQGEEPMVSGETVAESTTEHRTAMLLGAGVSWTFSPTTAVRLGYTWVDKALVGEYNLSYLALGLRYSF